MIKCVEVSSNPWSADLFKEKNNFTIISLAINIIFFPGIPVIYISK